MDEPGAAIAQPGLCGFQQSRKHCIVFDDIEAAELRRRSAERHDGLVNLRLDTARELAVLVGNPGLPIDGFVMRLSFEPSKVQALGVRVAAQSPSGPRR